MTRGYDENERNKRSFKKNIKRLNRSIIEKALDKTEDIETALYVLTVHQLSAILDSDCKGKDLTIPVVVSGCRLHSKENCGCGDIEVRYFNGYPGRPELVLETLKKYDIVDEVATLNDISFLFPSK